MAKVHRLGFTRLSEPEDDGDQFALKLNNPAPIQSYITKFLQCGFRSWPSRASHKNLGSCRGRAQQTQPDSAKKPRSFKSLFKQRAAETPSTSIEQITDSLSSSKVFWPEEFLVSDIPQAIVWTYDYNADVIGGLFQANNKNSVSQHGQDISVRLEREIDNVVT